MFQLLRAGVLYGALQYSWVNTGRCYIKRIEVKVYFEVTSSVTSSVVIRKRSNLFHIMDVKMMEAWKKKKKDGTNEINDMEVYTQR